MIDPSILEMAEWNTCFRHHILLNQWNIELVKWNLEIYMLVVMLNEGNIQLI